MEYDMVFEGGGAKGMVFVGALQELEALGHSSARLLGASAGAIMATFLAAGYNSMEMGTVLNEKLDGQPVFLGFLETPPELSKEEIQTSAIRDLLRDLNLALVPDFAEEKIDDLIAYLLARSSLTGRLFSFSEHGGFFAADNFLDWLQTKLNTGVYPLERGVHGKGKPREFGGMNLADYYKATGSDLSLVASDTTNSQLLILNHRTAPDCPLIWAVRMSMSIPLLWHEVVWQSDWGTYRGKDISGNTIVDGGMLSNFPIELFISNNKPVTNVMGEKKVADLNVLGFLIDETVEVPNSPPAVDEKKFIELEKLQTFARIKNLLNTMTQAHDKFVIESSEPFVIHLPAKGYGTIEFGMSDERRNALIKAGRMAVSEYFKRKEEIAFEGLSFDTPSIDVEEEITFTDRLAMNILDQ